MNSFAIYRFPYQKSCTAVMQHSPHNHIVDDCAELNQASGFVVAPFSICNDCQPVLIMPDERLSFPGPDSIGEPLDAAFDECCSKNALDVHAPAATRADYAKDFSQFHASLAKRMFKKLVLAREKKVDTVYTPTPSKLFARACADYPRLFIALFSSPVCGTWLVATPEVLIEQDGDGCRTMALAGTMKYEGDMNPVWSKKNIEEQQYVASYIQDSLRSMAATLDVHGPYTARAAGVVHLRTDYEFTATEETRLSDLITALHPTPAVCGLPKQQALDFILATEHTRRGYYSGYCGPVGIDGATRLFVSLRCMRIDKNSCRLYAGGGLLEASDEENEWQETENKMQTMERCLIKQSAEQS